MKALTICQPYAHLICCSMEKRVENREWYTHYRGPLLIHAGKSRKWLYEDTDPNTDKIVKLDHDEKTGESFIFGAVIGAARLVDCLHIDRIEAGEYHEKYPWLRDHPHASGTWCWVLIQRCRFQAPVPFTGAQGLFDIPESAVAEQIALLKATAA